MSVASMVGGRPGTPVRRACCTVLGGALLLALAPSALLAQRERYAPLLLQLPASARTLAMGGLSMGQRDAEALFGNPALVGGANAITIGGARYPSGTRHGVGGATMTIGALGVGLGVQLLDGRSARGDFPVRSDLLTGEGALGHGSVATTVAASLRWKGMRWGGALRYMEERFSDVRATAVGADLGVARDLLGGAVTTGLALQHLGGPLEIGETGEALPLRLSIGAATATRNLSRWFDVTAQANVVVRRDGRAFPLAGGELLYVPIEGVSVALRAGVRAPELRAQRPVTGGIGIVFDRLALDYGWEALRDGEGAHRVTLRVR